jgi:ABC-type amino acid transport substrate-binding protein
MRLPLLILLLTTLTLQAQEAAPAKLTVVAKIAPPFVIGEGPAASGYAVDLWKRVADELKLSYEIKTVPTVPELMEALKARQADVGLGALTISSDRQAVIDFSHPFYESGLQIIVQTEKKTGFFSAIRSVAGDLLTAILILLVALLANAHILWFLERRKNPENFPEGYPAGVWEAGWWSVCTLVTGGCENIAPRGVAGRLIAVVWMLTGFGLVSFVTARMASVMTVNTLTSEVRSLADLRGASVGTVAGTASETFLRGEPVAVRTFPTLDAAIDAVTNGDVKASVYDAPLLRYYLAQHPEAKLQLVGSLFEKHNYGVALQDKSPLRKDVSRIVLRLQEDGFLEQLDKKWFGESAKDAERKAEK